MNGIGCRGDAEEGAGHVERHAVDGARIGAAAKLIELLALGHGENSDDGARLACRGQQGAVVVEGDAGQRGAVGLDHIHNLEREGVEDEDVSRGDRRIAERGGRGVAWALVSRVVTRLRQGICEVAVLGRRRKGTYSARVGRRVDPLQEGHVGYVIQVYAVLENDAQAFAVQTDGEHSRGEAQLANNGTTLGVLDDEVAGREDEGDEGGREEHLDDGDVAIVAAEYPGERVGMVDAEALRGTYCMGGGLAVYDSLAEAGRTKLAGQTRTRRAE